MPQLKTRLDATFSVEQVIGGLMVNNGIENMNVIQLGSKLDVCITAEDIAASPPVVLNDSATTTAVPTTVA